MSALIDKIPANKTALVLIEYQNEFASEGGKLHPAVKPVMDNSNMLANSIETTNAARTKGAKIMHTPILFSPDFRELSPNAYGILGNVKNGECFVKGTWGADFCEGMKPEDKDIVVSGKTGLCGFESTNLQFLLGHNHIEYVVLGGFLTNCCVESTMRAAYEKGFKVITLTDCTAATSLEEQVCTETIFFHYCSLLLILMILLLALFRQDAAVKYTYPMFSVPMTHGEFLEKLV